MLLLLQNSFFIHSFHLPTCITPSNRADERPMGNKQSASIPAEYAKQIEKIEKLKYWTLEAVGQLEKVDNNRPIMKRPETDKLALEKRRPSNPLGRLHLICIKYGAQFTAKEAKGIISKDSGEQMNIYGNTFKDLSQNLVETQCRAFERVILPMKVWALEAYPTLLKDLKRCEKLKKAMVQAQKTANAKKDNKLLETRARMAKESYDSLQEYCKEEIARAEKLYWHQTLLWNMMLDIQMKHCQYVQDKLTKAMDEIMLSEAGASGITVPDTIDTE